MPTYGPYKKYQPQKVGKINKAFTDGFDSRPHALQSIAYYCVTHYSEPPTAWIRPYNSGNGVNVTDC